MHLAKNRTYACTFPVQRKEIHVVKVRFTMRHSSRKLSNENVITTACNFWRQIACSFQVMSGNILFLGNKIFEIPPFFQTRPGDLGKKVHACSLRFSALKLSQHVLKPKFRIILKCHMIINSLISWICKAIEGVRLGSLKATRYRSSTFLCPACWLCLLWLALT